MTGACTVLVCERCASCETLAHAGDARYLLPSEMGATVEQVTRAVHKAVLECVLDPSRPDRGALERDWARECGLHDVHPSAADDVLDVLRLPRSDEYRVALRRVSRRPPRGSAVPGWRRAIRRSRANYSYRRWLATSVERAVRDDRRRGAPVRVDPHASEVMRARVLERARQARLSEMQRRVLLAHLERRERAVDIARRLGLDESTVRTHLQRARERVGV